MGKKSNIGKKGENDLQHPASPPSPGFGGPAKSSATAGNIQQDEYLLGWKRALADYENLKRDLDKIKEENRNRIRVELAHTLLPVIDNFEQAVNHIPDLSTVDEKVRKNIEIWLQGVAFIKKQFEGAMNELGIERIPVSDEIDPNLHEIVGEADEQKEVLSGWKIGERVLRPVKVIIKKM